ncbi:hypothetical protein KEC55_19950 [Burkholderia cepacia]|uniref:hypothetical protein n=1 Tax=Burkholderia cepacia TaxID=292 RepID=UPI00249DA3C6|nr:hypothetical protein [Burkholderia cepacia]WGY72892.1 hypothetical protein KEC55_19950 [Burkholderia cepacia]
MDILVAGRFLPVEPAERCAHVTRRTIAFAKRTMLAAGVLSVERTEGAWCNGAWTDFFSSPHRPA